MTVVGERIPFNKLSIFILELGLFLITVMLRLSQMLNLLLQLPDLDITNAHTQILLHKVKM